METVSFGKNSYIVWELIAFILPFFVLLYFNFSLAKKFRNIFLYATIGALFFSWPWDYVMIKLNVWNYFPDKILGVWFLGLPLEEWVFIVFVTWFFVLINLILFKKYGKL